MMVPIHALQWYRFADTVTKAIIDEIDDYICPLYGLSQEEIDFIKNYELEFRLAGE